MQARVVAILVGAAFGTILDYVIAAKGAGGDGALSFGRWLAAYEVRNDAPWAYFGALSGYAIFECVRIIRQ